VFEPSLKAKLTSIFGLDKVTFDTPGESQEQEGMFISVDSAKMRIRDKRQIARVTGTIRVFASLDKMPFGFFSKSLANAAADDVKGLFFYDFVPMKHLVDEPFFLGHYKPPGMFTRTARTAAPVSSMPLKRPLAKVASEMVDPEFGSSTLPVESEIYAFSPITM